jgi:hypothetical protein
MIELFFIFYRIPKMMSRLAREHHQSPWKWSLIGIAAWIGGELLVAVVLGVFYAVGVELWGWPEKEPALFTLLLYVSALAAAVGGVALARRVLTSRKEFPPPPPPRVY